MSSSPRNSQQAFLPSTFIIPDPSDSEEFKTIMTDFIKKMLAAINAKTIGEYQFIELQTGQTLADPMNPQNQKSIYRTVVNFGALPNATTKEVNHMIQWSSQSRWIKIYGAANDPDTLGIPLPFASDTSNENIKLEVTDTVVRITTDIDYSNFTDSFIVLEYFKA